MILAALAVYAVLASTLFRSAIESPISVVISDTGRIHPSSSHLATEGRLVYLRSLPEHSPLLQLGWLSNGIKQTDPLSESPSVEPVVLAHFVVVMQREARNRVITARDVERTESAGIVGGV